MKKIIYLFILLNSLLSFSQNTETSGYQLENFAPKSPEAAAFLKYGEYPVDLSTGVANISIPLYTIDEGSFHMPITLDYHASGIKVTQESTWVGLGWNLKYGAQVILSVRDDVDENNPYIDTIPDDDEIISYWNSHPYSFNGGPVLNQNLDKSRVKDVYSFSSPTANGNFYIRNFATNDIVVFPPDASFKVELLGGSRANMGFIITDSYGNVYNFTNTKELSVRTMTHGDDYISAWFVDKIKTATNQEINFVYEADSNIIDYNFSQKIDVTEIGSNACSSEESIQKQISAVVNIGGTTITSSKKIREIFFNNNQSKVLFERINQREDLVSETSSSYLNSILIKHNENGEFVFKKGLDFNYSYFTSVNNENNLPYKNKRLKLDNIIDLIDGTGHTFSYSSIIMPSKVSKSQDYFGYYNAKGNSDLIPIHFKNSPYLMQVGSSDRSVNTNVNQAGMLTEVHYPTKGWTKFNYETNQYYGIDEFEKYKLNTVSTNTLQGTGLGSMNPTDFESPGIDDLPTCNLPNQNNCVQYRELNFEAINAAGQLTFQVVRSSQIPLAEMHYKYARVRIISNGVEIYDSTKLQDNWTELHAFSNLGSGKIIMEAYSQYVSIEGLTLKYLNNSQIPKNVNGAGLRVMSIENYDSDNNLLLNKEYEYEDINDISKSSGKLINNQAVTFETNAFNNVSIKALPVYMSWCIGAVDYTSAYSISSNSRYGIEGNTVAYKYVKEKQSDINNSLTNVFSIYKFSVDDDEVPFGDSSVQIFTSWKRGKLLEKKDYKTIEPNTYIVRKETNNYLEDSSRIAYINGFKFFRHCSLNFSTTDNDITQYCPFNTLQGSCYVPYDVFGAYELITYNFPIPWFYQNSTETTDYFYDSSNTLSGSVTNTTNYYYDNLDHLQLTRTESSNSNNETVKTVNYYPHDLVSNSPIMSTLISKNRIGEVVKKENFKNNSLLSSRNTIYKDWGNNLILPEIIQSSKGSPASFENRIRFNIVDNTNGNPLELQQENGTVVTYLWGYNKTLPIAKIENATNAQVQTALGINLSDVTEANMSVINSLRSSLPNAMISTYTHIPLVGVSTITDPKGDTITYTYDSYNRLIEVKDKNGNKLSENEYHYKP